MTNTDMAKIEMDTLEGYLREHKIPYLRERRWSRPMDIKSVQYTKRLKERYPDFEYGEQIWVLDENGDYKWDVIYGTGTYGFEKGLLEGMGRIFTGDDKNVLGSLTAQDIIELIEEDENG